MPHQDYVSMFVQLQFSEKLSLIYLSLQRTLVEDYKSLFSKKAELEKEYIFLSSKKEKLLEYMGPYPDILKLEEQKKLLVAEVGILEDISSLYAIKDNLQEEVRVYYSSSKSPPFPTSSMSQTMLVYNITIVSFYSPPSRFLKQLIHSACHFVLMYDSVDVW